MLMNKKIIKLSTSVPKIDDTVCPPHIDVQSKWGNYFLLSSFNLIIWYCLNGIKIVVELNCYGLPPSLSHDCFS